MTLRALAATMVVVTLAVTGSVLAAEKMAAKEEKKASAVQGEVLDLACYLGHGGMGEGHAGCAAKCLKGGQPMGLLGKDGTVYILLAGHDDASAFEKTKDFAGKKVEISGEVSTKDGLKAITISGVKAL
jgi:hypothetical protein